MANDIEIRVRVANQSGAGLAATTQALNRLRSAAREAGTAVERLRAESSRSVRLDTEFSGNVAEIEASARGMHDLQSNANRAGTALGALTPRATAAAAALEALQHAASEAGDELRTLRGRAAAATAALLELRAGSTAASTSLRSVSRSSESANGRMETLAGRTRALRDDMSELGSTVGRVGGSMSGLRGSLGTLSSSADRASSSHRRLLEVALMLSPALIPIGAAVVPVAAALTAGAVAAAAFGAAFLPQAKAMAEASKSFTKYQEAVKGHGVASAQAVKAEQAYLAQMAALDPATRRAAAGMSVLKDQYKAWHESLAGDTMPVATRSFAVLGALLPKLSPVVRTASSEMSRFMTILGGGIQSSSFNAFMARFNVFAGEVLARANNGVVRLITALDSGKASGGLAEFMKFAKDNGPLVAETLGNLGRAVGRVLQAASETGVGVLSLVNAFAKLVNAVPPDLLSGLIQLAVAFKGVQLASAGLALVAPRLAAAGAAAAAFTRSAQFGGVSAAVRGVAQSMTLLQRSTVVLGVIAAVAMAINELADRARGAPPDVDKLTDSLKRLGTTGKFTGELKRNFGDMDGFVKQMQKMRAETEAMDRIKPFMNLAGMGPLIEKFSGKLDDLARGADSASSRVAKFKAIDEAMSQLARSGHAEMAAEQFKEFEASLRGAGNTTEQIAATFPQYQAALESLKAEHEITAQAMGMFGEQAVATQAKLDAQKMSADGLRQSIQALNDVNRTALGGMIGFEAAIDAAAEAAKENADALHMVDGVLDLNSEKARAAATALSDLASKTDGAAASARENGASWETVSGIYERGREKLLASAQAMGLTEVQARSLASQIMSTPDKTAYLRGDMTELQAKLASARQQLASVPDSRRAEILANIRDLEAKVARAQAELNNLDDRTVYVRTIYQHFTEMHPGGQAQAHGGIIGAAGGGPRSRLTLVGEQGPELVDLAPGSRVRSNPDSRRIADGMTGGGGGAAVVEIRSSGSRVDDLLLEILRRSIRVQGGDVQLVLGSNR
jgi:hypothetical protein